MGQPYIACTSRTLCRTRLLLPHYTLGVQVGEPCRSCPLHTLVCRFRAALMPSGLDPETRGCVQCHATLRAVLQTAGTTPLEGRGGQATQQRGGGQALQRGQAPQRSRERARASREGRGRSGVARGR